MVDDTCVLVNADGYPWKYVGKWEFGQYQLWGSLARRETAR